MQITFKDGLSRHSGSSNTTDWVEDFRSDFRLGYSAQEWYIYEFLLTFFFTVVRLRFPLFKYINIQILYF